MATDDFFQPILGTEGDDTLDGNSNDNLLYGEGGNDKLNGGEGADTLIGGAGHDKLDGGAGHDILGGETGDDWLYGGAGDDTLDGGEGLDRLFGGKGADTFVFYGSESIASFPGDFIGDFSHADGDTIAFANIDANSLIDGIQSFEFIGSADFTGAGQLRIFERSGISFVQLSTANNGADYMFQVNSIGLTASDFQL